MKRRTITQSAGAEARPKPVTVSRSLPGPGPKPGGGGAWALASWLKRSRATRSAPTHRMTPRSRENRTRARMLHLLFVCPKHRMARGRGWMSKWDARPPVYTHFRHLAGPKTHADGTLSEIFTEKIHAQRPASKSPASLRRGCRVAGSGVGYRFNPSTMSSTMSLTSMPSSAPLAASVIMVRQKGQPTARVSAPVDSASW